MRIKRSCGPMCLRALFFFAIAVASSGSGGSAAEKSTVKTESLAVYAEATAESDIIKTLAKGDLVSVSYELSGSDGDWCAIVKDGDPPVSGYVLCRNLERKISARMWTATGSRTVWVGSPPSQSTAVNSAASAKPKRPVSDITVHFYVTDW